ncbi:ABC-type uncharacterized transport system permease subunit [Streptosporangium album]|uniref:ABC-type uncharacterized transport system permease subunit n=1 Tax=Streptosporangium album TaxID=47479 RepID=A0A7W7S533_9ACTN|nr:ABC-2 family transporter protein [Streptosporangium album]MBB4943862.1 ABC-type uncharacterized transport system permease subunit [Streptosporangium album]
MMAAGSLAVNALDVLAIWVIFQHTGSPAGFDLAEVMFLYGTASLSFALSDMLFGNVDRLSPHIRAGTFGTMLIRPAGAFVQVATDRFGVHRLGKTVQALIVLCIALSQLGVPPAFANWQPGLFVLDRPGPLGLPYGLRFAAPLAALALAVLAVLAWRAGIRRYRSTGS